jgi:hypothetical protein
LWPASATWHVVGFAGAAWALALASEGGPPAKGWGAGSEAALLASLTAVGAAALESFTQMLPGAAGPWPRMALWLAGLTAATVAAWLARRNRLARLAAVFLSLLTLLAAATLALYQFG